jgi:hypothetical protein
MDEARHEVHCSNTPELAPGFFFLRFLCSFMENGLRWHQSCEKCRPGGSRMAGFANFPLAPLGKTGKN